MWYTSNGRNSFSLIVDILFDSENKHEGQKPSHNHIHNRNQNQKQKQNQNQVLRLI